VNQASPPPSSGAVTGTGKTVAQVLGEIV